MFLVVFPSELPFSAFFRNLNHYLKRIYDFGTKSSIQLLDPVLDLVARKTSQSVQLFGVATMETAYLSKAVQGKWCWHSKHLLF